MLAGRQRVNGHGDSPTAHRNLSYPSIARIRSTQSNFDSRMIQRATGVATEVQQVIDAPSPMHSSPRESKESAHEVFQEGIQEAEASGSSSRGVYKQASTSSRGGGGMQPFSYAPAESDQIRESWDSLMRWSKVSLSKPLWPSLDL
jgi:hypothetical protein